MSGECGSLRALCAPFVVKSMHGLHHTGGGSQGRRRRPRSGRSGGAMKFSEFARIYQVRGAQMMWFLGAGASANANVPTAGDMIWEFKASLYASREKVSLAELGDLGDSRTRAVLQRYFDTR